jgi:hypothetical protein
MVKSVVIRRWRLSRRFRCCALSHDDGQRLYTASGFPVSSAHRLPPEVAER